MKKAKVLVATVLASGLVLSGCSFEEALETAKNWPVQNVYEPAKAFFEEKILGKKPQEAEPEKEEKQDEGEKPAPAPVAQLLSISVSGQFKSEYDIGEAFDATGVVVTAAYDDGSTQDVSSQASFSGFDSSQAGECTVSVSFEGQSAEFTVSVAKLSWFASEKALFDEHLHGIELPFFPVEGATVVESATSAGTLNILDGNGENLAVSGTTVSDYAALFSAADGWEDVSSDYSAYSSAEAGSFWVFERSTQTSEGMRRISVQFFGHNGSKYALSGNFYLYASDPFSYEFPADLIAAEFAKYQMTPFTIPAPDAQDMYFEFYPDSYNATYYAYGYDDYMNATIYFYGFTAETFAAYVSKLEQAGWVFTSQDYSGTTVYSGTLSIENVGTATIEQLYFTPTFSSLNYDYLIVEPAAWPAEDAAALVEKFAPGSSTVIPECPNGTSYKAYMGNTYNEIDVGGDESLKDAYAAILKDAGWTETADGSYIFVSPAQDIQITLQYTSYGLEIRVAAYIPPAPEWPAQDVAALLPSGGQDSLPAYEGANSYQLYNDNYGMGVTVFVGEGNEDAAIAAYGELLEATNFVLDNNGFYVSEHDEFKVELWKGTDGAFNVEITILNHFPAEEMAAKMAALGNFTDPLPGIDYAASYTVNGNSEKAEVACDFDTSANATAALAEYKAALLAAGFVYAGDDAYGTSFYNSPNGQFNVNPYTYYYYLVIDVFPGEYVPAAAGWPAADIAAYLKTLDPEITDVVPEFETEGTFIFDDSGYYADLELGLSFDSADEAAAAVTAYEAILVQANYTATGSGYYGTEYTSPNGQLIVTPYAYGSTFYIDIDLAS